MSSWWKITEALDQQRTKLFAVFQREYQITYGNRLVNQKQLFDRYQKIFSERTIEELQYYIDQVKGSARDQEEYRKVKERRQEKEDRRALHTRENSYSRVEDDVQRVVCGDNDPEFDKTGMPCFGGDHNDPELKGYYFIHVGDAEGWLPILLRDGYCEGSHAYIYEVMTSELARTRTPFYSIGEDYHIADKTNTPDSNIIFSKLPVIPAQYVVLKEVIDLANVDPAPDPY